MQRRRGGVAQQVMGRVEGKMLIAGAGQAAQRIVVVAMNAGVFIDHLQQLAQATERRSVPLLPDRGGLRKRARRDREDHGGVPGHYLRQQRGAGIAGRAL